MSDQQETGIALVLDLEGLFLSREFGRRPVRSVATAPATVASEPAQLEQVFLSDAFGHPEVVAAATRVLEESAPAVSIAARPALVVLKGGADGGLGRDTSHYRAIAAVSGVAAAALAVAGLAPGTGHGPGNPPVTEQAQGVLPGQVGPGAGAGSRSGPAGATVLPVASGGGSENAVLASFSAPVLSAVPPRQAGAAGSLAAVPAGSGSSPGTPPGSGVGGGMLAPALNLVGNDVSSVGSSASSTAGDVEQALPVASVLQTVGTVATSAVNNLGGGTPPTISAGALKQ